MLFSFFVAYFVYQHASILFYLSSVTAFTTQDPLNQVLATPPFFQNIFLSKIYYKGILVLLYGGRITEELILLYFLLH